MGAGNGPRPPRMDGGCEVGAITAQGIQQAVDFGTWLRKRYLESLHHGHPSSSSLVDLIRATAAKAVTASKWRNKSLATLTGVLSGLLVGKEGQIVPVHVPSHHKDEYLVPNSMGCKALGLMMRLMDHQVQLKALKDSGDGGEGNRDSAMTIKMHIPELVRGSNWITWKKLLDAIMSMEAHNLTLPSSSPPDSSGDKGGGGWRISESLSDEDAVRVYLTIDKEATLRVSGVLGPACNEITSATMKQGVVLECQQLMKLSAGIMMAKLKGILSNLTGGLGLAEGTAGGPKLHLYSAYDSTLFPLLSALGHKVKTWPPFMSSLVIEVWKAGGGEGGKGGDMFVSVAWNGKTLPLAGVGMDAGSSNRTFLSLQEFGGRVFDPYLVDDLALREKECAAKVQLPEGGPGEMHVQELIGIERE